MFRNCFLFHSILWKCYPQNSGHYTRILTLSRDRKILRTIPKSNVSIIKAIVHVLTSTYFPCFCSTRALERRQTDRHKPLRRVSRTFEESMLGAAGQKVCQNLALLEALCDPTHDYGVAKNPQGIQEGCCIMAIDYCIFINSRRGLEIYQCHWLKWLMFIRQPVCCSD